MAWIFWPAAASRMTSGLTPEPPYDCHCGWGAGAALSLLPARSKIATRRSNSVSRFSRSSYERSPERPNNAMRASVVDWHSSCVDCELTPYLCE